MVGDGWYGGGAFGVSPRLPAFFESCTRGFCGRELAAITGLCIDRIPGFALN
ncbi:hypothetical protein LX24_02532 [Desulfallas thermosapovorans DSM 6562]|uniref:Uncharacterized protein n=1 Tax=Desulfallas thermosapovorans DSM 6562 TaxID=1121431 RepID=A0A5S4ZNL2_9FIRM|nr:hypothetical protein LX24_02532 [Desulfallas thermosapovorans DSM 6562]